ncbi:HU family DNA-binding protein [Microvirga sp. BT291]|nr:HU family DNA-binding protein [Microvirga pudoricolor]
MRTSTAKATKAAQGKAASSKAASGKAAAKGALAKVPAKPARGASKATAAGAVLTLRHIAEEIALGHELAKRQANELMAQVVEIITRRLKKGDKIRLSGLGILQVKKRAARMGRNPATGEAIKIKASKKIAFRPAKELKDSI